MKSIEFIFFDVWSDPITSSLQISPDMTSLPDKKMIMPVIHVANALKAGTRHFTLREDVRITLTCHHSESGRYHWEADVNSSCEDSLGPNTYILRGSILEPLIAIDVDNGHIRLTPKDERTIQELLALLTDHTRNLM